MRMIRRAEAEDIGASNVVATAAKDKASPTANDKRETGFDI